LHSGDAAVVELFKHRRGESNKSGVNADLLEVCEDTRVRRTAPYVSELLNDFGEIDRLEVDARGTYGRHRRFQQVTRGASGDS